MRYKLMTFVIVAVMAGPMVAKAQTEAAEADKVAAEQDRKMQEAEMKLEEAQRQLEEAAREMAELGIQTDSDIEVFRHIRAGGRKAMLGINIGVGDGGAGTGVMVEGVTPGGPADQAGLKAGDVITKVGETSLTAESSRASNRKLLERMRDVEPGEDVKLVYQRDGKSQEASVRTKAAAFSCSAGEMNFLAVSSAFRARSRRPSFKFTSARLNKSPPTKVATCRVQSLAGAPRSRCASQRTSTFSPPR